MKLNQSVLVQWVAFGVVVSACATTGSAAIGSVTGPFAIARKNLPVSVALQQNDRRSAIAKVDPNKPIQIRVVSQTNVPVVAFVRSATGYRPVSPGQSVTFGRLHTSYLSFPIDLQVSLENSPNPDNPIGVDLEVKTASNEIIVGVKTSKTNSGPSSRAIHVDNKGLIYLY